MRPRFFYGNTSVTAESIKRPRMFITIFTTVWNQTMDLRFRVFTRSIVAALALALIAPVGTLASGSGQSGRTALSSAGCAGGGCHGGASNSVTTVRVLEVVGGRLSANTGEIISFTVVVANPNRQRAGVGIAVKSTETGSTNAGTLSTIAGEGTRMSAGEITHSGSKVMTDGEASFRVSWTAPAQAGTYYLRAIGNAVNGDGSASGQDQWNWLTPVEIVVSPSTSVDETSVVNVVTSPVPAHDHVSVTVPSTSGERLSVSVMDGTGQVVATDVVVAAGEALRYTWNGRRDDGSLAPQGVYTIAILGERRLMKGRAIIVR